MKPNHFHWSCCGPCLKKKKKKNLLSNIFRCCPKEVSIFTEELHKQKGQIKQNGGKEVYIFSASIDACILPPFHFIISVTFFPHPLWAPVEITGELSVCGKACLSSRGSRGEDRLRRRGKRDSCFAVLLCCLWHSFLCVSGDNLFSTGPFIQGLSTGVRQDGK